MSPSEIPPGYAVPPGVGLVRLAPPPGYVIPPGYIAATSYPVPLWPVPPPAPAPPPQRRYRSAGMMAAGIVLVSVGATLFVGGAVYLGTRDWHCAPVELLCGLDKALAGSLTMAGGAVLGGAVGAPLWSIGASEPPEPKRSPWGAPSVMVGPGSASLRWTF